MSSTSYQLGLFDCPTEIVSQILVQAVISRGIKRALRLRLVCKRFSKDIKHAIFESRILDSVKTVRGGPLEQAPVLSKWYIENDHGVSEFWHAYLVYRVLNSTYGPSERRHSRIREVAEIVCHETGADLRFTIEKLCWPALERGTDSFYQKKLELELPNPGLDLLAAAAYLNILPIAEQLLQEGYSPYFNNSLFFSPVLLAAWAGHTEMLELLQTFGGTSEDAVIGASQLGDTAMLRLAIQNSSIAMQDTTNPGQAFGAFSDPRFTLGRAKYHTRSPGLYEYLGSIRGENPDNRTLSSMLGFHAHLGNLEMVKYFLDAGADVRGVAGRFYGNPLIAACRRSHEDIVDLLLKGGADPNYHGEEGREQHGYPIAAAVASGSLSIVRKVLQHGLDLSHKEAGIPMCFHALQAAIRGENTRMLKYLVKKGAYIGGEYGSELLKSAISEGLDSMAQELREMGVSLMSEESVVDETH